MEKRKIWNYLVITALSVGIVLSGHADIRQVKAVTTQCTIYPGDNMEDQNYSIRATTVKSYLTATEDGYMRVQYGSNISGYLVEYYDTSYNLLQSRMIEEGLPVWGAFYETEENYYILSGQNNPEESDDVEVYRITQYDKDWNRITSCGLYGANTFIPFDAGSARMAHSGDQLIIRTCHEMYESSDGLHHQANVTIQVDMSSMEITDSFTDVMNVNYGYVSHSFNQFVGIENGHIVAVDHGDAYPRSIVLVKYSSDISQGKFTSFCNSYNLVPFEGAIGANYTGASIGGFAISDTSYLVAGNQDIEADNSLGGRNIFVVSQNKESDEVNRIDITDYEVGDGAYTPHLVSLGADRYLLLWNKKGITYYTELDKTGIPIGEIYELEGELSDCVPIVRDGKVVWYTWENGNITFYEIRISDMSDNNTVLIENGHQYEYGEMDENGMVTRTCTQCADSGTFKAPTTFSLWWGTLSSSSTVYSSRYAVGNTLYAWKTGMDGDSEVQEMEFISSNPEVISTEPYSKLYERLSMNGPGITTITARLKYNPSVSRRYTFRVGEDGDVSLNECSLEMDTSYIYTGSAIVPEITLSYNGHLLSKNTDYSVTVTNNNGVGTGTVTITGAGLFEGSMEKDFEIRARTLDDCEIMLSRDTYVFSGAERKPEVTVTYNGNVLSRSMYSYTIADNVYPGTAVVTLTGESDTLQGTAEKTFEITKWDMENGRLSVHLSEKDQIYDGTAKTPTVSLYNEEEELISAAYYDLFYENNRDAGVATVTVVPKDEYKDYITGELSFAWEIAPLDINQMDLSLDTEILEYNGQQQRPIVTVSDGEHLVDLEECTVSYENNVNPGTAKVVVTGDGNYTGKAEGTFIITKGDMSKCTIEFDETGFLYDGTEKEPPVIVKNGENTVDEAEYIVSYSDNINAGNAKVIITGNGNYEGILESTFPIERAVPDIGTVRVIYPETIYTTTSPASIILERSNGTVEGSLFLDTDEFTLGMEAYTYTFRPEDADNYKEVQGTISIFAIQDILTSIDVEGIAERTDYRYGDTFDLAGLRVLAYFESGMMLDVTDRVETSALSVGNTEVVLSYTNTGITKTCVVTGITVGKKLVSVKHLYWNVEGSPYSYDGNLHGVVFTGTIPEEITVQMEGYEAVFPGTYTAKAILSLAEGYDENYEIEGEQVVTADWSIEIQEEPSTDAEDPGNDSTEESTDSGNSGGNTGGNTDSGNSNVQPGSNDKQDTKPSTSSGQNQNQANNNAVTQAQPIPTEAVSNKKTADKPTKFNIKNKKTYKKSKKVTIKDADGIKSIKLNSKSIKVKSGKKSFSFKLSKYKKYLKKKTKWNKLVVTDVKGRKKTIKFKTK